MSSIKEAIAYIEALADGDEAQIAETLNDLKEFKFSEDFEFRIRLPEGYHSEVPAQFLKSYHDESQALLRIIALMLNGRADIKTLTNEQLSKHNFSVHVSEGSSNLVDNAKDVLGAALEEAIEKMSGKQVVITILGVAVLTCTAWGFNSYVEATADVRKDEIQSEERVKSLETFSKISADHDASMVKLVEILKESGPLGQQAVTANDNIQDSRLQAASKTNVTEFNGLAITGEQAKELRGRTRRKTEIVTVEREMRVVDVNTADAANTTLVLEDPTTGEQIRVTYAERILGTTINQIAIDALQHRSNAIFKLEQKMIGDETISVEIQGARAIPSDDASEQTISQK